MFLLIGINQ